MEDIQEMYDNIEKRIDEKCQEIIIKAKEDCNKAHAQLNEIRKRNLVLLKDIGKIRADSTIFFKETEVGNGNCLGIVLEKKRESGPSNWIPTQLTKIDELDRNIEHEYLGDYQRASLIGNEIWAFSRSSSQIDVLSLDGLEKLRTFEIEGMDYDGYWSAVEAGEGIVLVAAGNHGLLQTNMEGRKETKVLEGEISDVALYNDTVFVLDNGECRVQVFKRDNAKKQFSFQRFFELEDYSSRYIVNTIHATSRHVYIVNMAGANILQYSIDGEFIRSFGGKTGDRPSEMEDPYIVGTDAYDTVLIADSGNNRFQTLTSKGKFAVVKDDWPRDFDSPTSAAFIGNRFIVCNENKSIRLFSLN